MKILHINEHFPSFGGAEKVLLDICLYLKDNGHDVTVISSNKKETYPVEGIKNIQILPSFGVRSGLKGFIKVYKILREEKPDIIHIHNVQNFISPLILLFIIKKWPTIKTAHDTRFFCPSNLWKVLKRENVLCTYPLGALCFNMGCLPFNTNSDSLLKSIHKFIVVASEMLITRRVNKLIVSSDYIEEELVKNKFESRKIELVQLYTDKSVSKNHSQNKNNDILYIGRLEITKGIMQFIEVLINLPVFNWKASIIGVGNEMNRAIALVEKYKIADKVTFYGQLPPDELDLYYQKSTIVVVPSMIPESFSIVGVEAMAFGKPIVAFDSGGIKQWLQNGVNGFVVKRGDVQMMSLRIALLLNDMNLRKSMGTAGMELVETNFTKERYMGRMLDIYENLK